LPPARIQGGVQMLKSALGIVLSVLMLAVAIPPVQATSTGKAAAKKHAVKKAAAKHSHHVFASAGKQGKSKKRIRIKAAQPIVSVSSNAAYQPVSYAPSNPAAQTMLTAGDLAGRHAMRDPQALKSNAALVLDQGSSQVLFEKNASLALPIASLTKLMTALIVVEARQNLDDVLEVSADDIDREKNSSSRLRVGARMSRANMLHIALMSSENRAASALGRHYPGGLPAFVAAMNAKAAALGMTDTRYVDSTGLSSRNVASARDLAKLVISAYQHPLIREYSTDPGYAVSTGRSQLQYMNSNRLVKNPGWEIGLQKTGYIAEAGRCLVMQARVDGRPVVMVFLDSKGKESRLADAGRIRKWLEVSKPYSAGTQLLTQAGMARS
jgi:serine-type D-Ala-D-Ala endopeptidase (penicillin-binding protein 7)